MCMICHSRSREVELVKVDEEKGWFWMCGKCQHDTQEADRA